jgi:hypothetical protein
MLMGRNGRSASDCDAERVVAGEERSALGLSDKGGEDTAVREHVLHLIAGTMDPVPALLLSKRRTCRAAVRLGASPQPVGRDLSGRPVVADQ